jgi:leucine-zipper of insertion element IS481
MKLHANHRTCPSSRRLICRRVLEEGWTVRQAAEAAGCSVRTAAKWLARYRGGDCCLADRPLDLLAARRGFRSADVRRFCRALFRTRTVDPLLTILGGPATGRNRWQRFWLVRAVFGAIPFATGCHRLRPLCSINAPCLGVHEGNTRRGLG